jgi:hypothetical protein
MIKYHPVPARSLLSSAALVSVVVALVSVVVSAFPP